MSLNGNWKFEIEEESTFIRMERKQQENVKKFKMAVRWR